MGTPPMNLFPRGLFVPGKTTGVRPEHLILSSPSDPVRPGDARFDATVDFTESLGSETLVHLKLRTGGGEALAIARVAGFSPLRSGDAVVASFDPGRAAEF
jgi:ABC-type sugar transport system ATPase subunit